MDDLELFGHFEDTQRSNVVSLRHGNTFGLANKTVLSLSGLVGRKKVGEPVMKFIGPRTTTVNLSFIVPISSKYNTGKRLAYRSIIIISLELILTGALATFLVFEGIGVGVLLLACVATTHFILVILQQLLQPICAHKEVIQDKLQKAISDERPLDIHIITIDWNSSQLDVVCGLSKHVHSLTNIPIRIDKPRLMKWSCRLLAFVLAVQAAALASVVGSKSQELGSIAWLAMYLLMLLPSQFQQVCPAEELLKNQNTTIIQAEPVHFSGRRAALAFIAMLPVSPQVNRWAWLDVFMPNNERRRAFQTEWDKWPLINKREGEKDMAEAKMLISSNTKDVILHEATAAYNDEKFVKCLRKFEDDLAAASNIARGDH
jgi:hypothetical protein